jgi:hypothetical protein
LQVGTALALEYHERMDQLLKHQQDSQSKFKHALEISERILALNNQLIAENYKLAGVEKDISANSIIIDYICSDMKKIGRDIEVQFLPL